MKNNVAFSEKDLKRLRRRDLAVLLLDQAKLNDALKTEIKEMTLNHAKEVAALKELYEERLCSASASAEERISFFKEQLSVRKSENCGEAAIQTATRMYEAIKEIFPASAPLNAPSAPSSVVVKRKRYE